MNYWLMKSEPDECSIDDVLAAPGQKTAWSGVRNYTARNFMRDRMRIGDGVFFYHSSCPEPGIAGLAEIASTAYTDASHRSDAAAARAFSARRGNSLLRHPDDSGRDGSRAALRRRRGPALRAAAARRAPDRRARRSRPGQRAALRARCRAPDPPRPA